MFCDKRDKKSRKQMAQYKGWRERVSSYWKLYKKTTCQSISEYARNILLEKPVIIKYRNESADQFLTQMIAFKTN